MFSMPDKFKVTLMQDARKSKKTTTFISQQTKKIYDIPLCQLPQQLRYGFDGAHIM